METLTIREVTEDEHSAILSVYEAVGYDGGIKDEDIGFLASIGEKPVGAVRLSQENGILVLRGMMVHPDFQRQGIGKELLKALDRHIGSVECYCINPTSLKDFYGSISFNQIDAAHAPSFLIERLNEYNREKHKCIMMFRHKK